MAKTTRTNKRKVKDASDDEILTKPREPNTKKRKQDKTKQATATKKAANGSDDDEPPFVFTRAPVSSSSGTRTAAKPRADRSPPSDSRHKAELKATTPATMMKPIRDIGHSTDSFVALPVSDTPIIRRNQQLRQEGGSGRRRSSLTMRGKRASSMGNFSQSLPHPDIEYGSFYKHINADLPEPIRMKQLVTWCARKDINDQKTSSQTSIGNEGAIARVMEEEVLKDVMDNQISVSWYHKPEKPLPPPVIERLHPQNIENEELEKNLASIMERLKQEEDAWNQLLQDYTTEPQSSETERFPDSVVDLDLLPAGEAQFMHSLDSRPPEHLSDLLLSNLDADLEFQVDSLYHALHTQNQLVQTTNEKFDQILETAAKALADREKKLREHMGTEAIGTGDILRTLARR